MRRNRRAERGEGNFGCLVGVILLLIAVFIAYKMIPIKVKAAEVRQTMENEAKAAGTHSDERIVSAIVEKARENNLPVTEENVHVERASNNASITVDVEYDVPVQFPGYNYNWHFHHHANNPIF
jgi:hypothetical protein